MVELTEHASKTQYLIPSVKVKTYDKHPAMIADLITKTVIDHYNDHDVFIINYANADMVGHTGNLEATIKSIQALDKAIAKLYEYFSANNGVLFITGDHVNADQMKTINNEPLTTHTTAKVPLIITDYNVSLKANESASILQIAPTILDYLNLPIPNEMDQESLLIKK